MEIKLVSNGFTEAPSSIDRISANHFSQRRKLAGVPPSDPEGAARCFAEAGAAAVVITLGEKGALVQAEGKIQYVPAHRVDTVDTVGAGDAFNGALAVALAEGRPLTEAVRWAGAAGALAVTRVGAQAALGTRRDIDALSAAQSHGQRWSVQNANRFYPIAHPERERRPPRLKRDAA